MSTRSTSGLSLVRSDFAGQPRWALVGSAALAQVKTDHIRTGDLESLPVDRQELRALVEDVMDALERYGSSFVSTPGGAGWLHVQHVPVRRFVAEILRKLLALDAWAPFASAPGPLALAPYEGRVGLRSSSSREYLAYTVTWSGIAYLLGADAPYNPTRSAQLRNRARVSTANTEPSPLPADLQQRDVVALSWTSRHAATLMPVLAELERDGATSLLLDLATDPAERCPGPTATGIDLRSAPSDLFTLSGITEDLHPADDEHVVRAKGHSLQLARLVMLLSVLLETSGGCTQPSWRTMLGAERWLDGVLAATRPHTVLLSNDTSPLGTLAAHAAERHGANTVHVQHGAWTAESVAWQALHSRDIVVMGERDVPLARAWVRHPDAEVHVLGQPRFDALAALGREAQRRYLEKVLAPGNRRAPARVAVWACQPFSPGHLKDQADLLLNGLNEAEGDWGLVIAPHPAQGADAFTALLKRDGGPPVAVADPRVGARGCLAGADALASAYSTCGIEAALLGVPVLEIGSPGERTLDLAGHGLATRCHYAADVAEALGALPEPGTPVAKTALDAVCRWRGDSAAQVARLITQRAETSARSSNPLHHDAPSATAASPQGEGVPAR
uniref:Capsule polysaccharide biosynthesis protein n=1 Tax=Streptomyces sp. NBC_00008 TaxID=2903610 RepID=A0AAU2VM16_9ACTN